MSGADAVPIVPTVRAAGCVLWRRIRDGRPGDTGTDTGTDAGTDTGTDTGTGIEIALVHRPRYDDWSHPKGKLKRHESERDAAVREVREETGMECDLGAELPTAHYLDARGRPKTVRYWAARATDGTFAPNREVDALLWLPPDEARERLTHPRDASLLPAFLASLRDRRTLL